MNSEMELAARLKALEARIRELERVEAPGRAAAAFGSAVGMLQMLPGICGVWPGSAVGASGQMLDLSGNELHLTNNNAARLGNVVGTMPPVIATNGTTQYFSRASEAAFQITGTEAYILNPGLTLGGWFRFDVAASAVEALIYKLNSTDRNYLLQRRDTGQVRFGVYSSNIQIDVTSSAITAGGSWYFLAGRFTPSGELKVWANSETSVNTTSIPASLDTDAAPFTIGASAIPGSYLDGRASLCFLCASVVPDIFIDTYYNLTAPLFGVTS